MQSTRHARQWIGVGVVVAVVLAAALYVGLRAAPSWPSAFCQPVSRVVGVDATRILGPKPGLSPAMGFVLDSEVLHRDIGNALAHAPTAQLRDELATYRRAGGEHASHLEITTALSRFDSLVRTQLQRCDIHSIGR